MENCLISITIATGVIYVVHTLQLSYKFFKIIVLWADLAENSDFILKALLSLQSIDYVFENEHGPAVEWAQREVFYNNLNLFWSHLRFRSWY